MCGSGAPGTSICGGCEEEEEVISAAFCLKREKGLAGLPPVPRGAAPPSAVALLREVKGRKETMFSKEDEGGEEEEEKRSMLEGLRSTVRKKEKKQPNASFDKLDFFQRAPCSFPRSARIATCLPHA